MTKEEVIEHMWREQHGSDEAIITTMPLLIMPTRIHQTLVLGVALRDNIAKPGHGDFERWLAEVHIIPILKSESIKRGDSERGFYGWKYEQILGTTNWPHPDHWQKPYWERDAKI